MYESAPTPADPPSPRPAAGSTAALLAELAARPADAGTLAALERIDPSRLDAGAKVDYLCATERAAARVAALQQQALSAIDVTAGGELRRPSDLDDDWAREQVGAALRLHPITANRRLAVARTLVDDFPGTLRALADGRITYLQAAVIVEGGQVLTTGQRAALEDRVLPKAEQQTVGDTRRAVERAVLSIAPRQAEARHASAMQGRAVGAWPLPDAMGEIRAVVGADGMVTTMTALNGLVDAVLAGNPADPRTAAQLRADLFVEVFDAILHGTDVPSPYFAPDPAGRDQQDSEPVAETANPAGAGAEAAPAQDDAPRVRRRSPRRGRRAQLTVTACAETASGAGDQPGELDGYGPIPASMVRRIAARADWRLGLTDPATGRLVGLGPLVQNRAVIAILDSPAPATDLDVDWGGYRPPAETARFVRARDRHCTFPGCRRRAALCDLDHLRPWPNGPTSAANLHCLCRRHHRLKTAGRWRVRRNADGGLTWTAPTGHTYRAPPREAA